MVGPSSSEDREDAMARLKAGAVLLVGLSAGLTALQGGGTVVEIGVAIGGGLVVGWLLVWYLVWSSR